MPINPKKSLRGAEFAGMTDAECAGACNVGRCVISGKSYCAHPMKGSLYAPDMHNPAALGRLARAKKLLGFNRAVEKFSNATEDQAS
jgi:hypothetical protein